MTAFSVIVPFRNAERTIAATAASILGQSLTDWEAIFIDDGSSDASVNIVAGLAKGDARIRLLTDGKRTPHGVARTRNAGIAVSHGRYIAFLDADDLWAQDKLAAQQQTFDRHEERIVFGSYMRVGADGRERGLVQAIPRVDFRAALSGNPIGCLTAAFDTEFYGRATMPEIPMHEDYAFWLDLLRQGSAARGLPQVLGRYRVSAGSASANKLRGALAVWRILGMQDIPMAVRIRGMFGYTMGAVRKRV